MKIVLTEDIFDCQVKRGLIYIWDTFGQVVILDIRQLVSEISRDSGSNITIELNHELIDKYAVSYGKIEGGVFPMDTVIEGGKLYVATETGLFKRYIGGVEKKRRYDDIKAVKLIDAHICELSTGRTGTIAMAAGKDGVLELYNPKKMRISKWEHSLTKEITRGIYLVHGKDARTVMFEEQNIVSSDKRGCFYRMNFLPMKSAKKGEVVVRSYKNTSVLEGVPEALTISNEKILEARTKNLPAISTNHTLIRKVIKGTFGIAYISKQEVIVDTSNYGVRMIEGPITRCRMGSGFGGVNNLLITVLDDRVEISDFKSSFD